MLSFYPGPSRVYDEIPRYVRDAHRSGLLGMNHRSPEFVQLSAQTISLLKDKLEIPAGYTIFFTSSATECWEIIAQSLVDQASYHIFNGAFGAKWFEYTRRIRPGARSLVFERESEVVVDELEEAQDAEVICLTQNETSNGTEVSNETLRRIRRRFPNHLLAIDATSSMAGIFLDFAAADIWFASVQKCFGLPAGLALLICSPAAIKRAQQLDERDHYNSLVFMADMMAKWQTTHTPNVLNIYLLNRVMEAAPPIRTVDRKTRSRYRQWMSFLKDRTTIQHLIANQSVHSLTVLPIRADTDGVNRIKEDAKTKGILLGEGYGDLKATTFRIANFPAIRDSEIRALKSFLSDYQ